MDNMAAARLATLSAGAAILADLGHVQTAKLMRDAINGLSTEWPGVQFAMVTPPRPELMTEPPKPSRKKAPPKDDAPVVPHPTADEARAAGATFTNAKPADAPKTVADVLAGERRGLRLAAIGEQIGTPNAITVAQAVWDSIKVEWAGIDNRAGLEAWLADNDALLHDIAAISPNAAGAVENQVRAKIKVKLEGMA